MTTVIATGGVCFRQVIQPNDFLIDEYSNEGDVETVERIDAPTRTVAIRIPGTNTLLAEGAWVHNDMPANQTAVSGSSGSSSGSASGSGSGSGSESGSGSTSGSTSGSSSGSKSSGSSSFSTSGSSSGSGSGSTSGSSLTGSGGTGTFSL